MRIEDEIKLTFDDVLIRPKRSTLVSRSEVDLTRDFKFKYTPKTWSGVPIISANMDTTGTFETAKSLEKFGILTALHKFYNIKDWEENLDFLNPKYLIVTVGSSEEEFEKAKKILNLNNDLDFICLDVANGYREDFLQSVTKFREAFPEKIIMAGNVATREMTEAIILAGADIVKVGIGPGSVCTTRKVAGVGYPQLSSISECADAAHGLGGHVISDGGCKFPGDVAKAFGAGSDFVMLGGMFAGHTESGGDLITDDNGQMFKDFYGMSSELAQQRYYGDLAEHRASEGKKVRLKYKGSIDITVQSILGGVRSACSYVGAKNLKDLPKCTTFIRVTQTTNEIFTTYEN
ncbi:MAG: GMP reductase [Actinomycetota bacterium]|nr:GMP reductase [Actinomycetota bacterium]MDA3012995.1 GMP reductase [Actinomycetota bacterium]